MFASVKGPLAALAAAVCLLPATATAQDSRFRVSAGAAAAAASGDADTAFNGTVGYRFSEHLWFEADVTGVDAPIDHLGFYPFYALDRPQGAARVGSQFLRASPAFRANPNGFGTLANVTLPTALSIPATLEGNTIIGTLGLRYELPVQGGRLRPYLAAGLGLARTEQEFDVRILGGNFDDSVSDTGYAASAGVGASLRLVKQVSLDVDARYFRLSRERNLMRMGGGLSIRF
jgi:opacity protein-like surface antigen